MVKTTTLIVGQGIAGTLAAFMLYRQDHPFLVIDPQDPNGSSQVAAGMFTPISGKRKTIQPLVAEQIPFAIKIYRELEQMLGINFLHLQHIYQVYHDSTEQETFAGKLLQDHFGKYINTSPAIVPNLHQPWGACEINQSGWVDCAFLLSRFSEWLQQKELLRKEIFNYGELVTSKSGMRYRDLQFENIIFCEGYRAAKNPFFNNESIIPCKGNVLTIRCDGLAGDRIIKKNGFYLVPLGNDIFKVGATYQWNNDTLDADAAGGRLIEEQLNELLETGYTLVNHRAGIRPTTKNREVVALRHPEHAHMYMLNGLGTRGVLHGPWWANRLIERYFQNVTPSIIQ